MARYFAAFLDLRGRSCLVVGGGPVGERKVRALLACGGRVTVVSPTLTPGLAALARAGRLAWRRRPFLRSDARRRVLVIAATGRADGDAAVAVAARHRGALVNVVDRPGHCDFIFPAVLRRGELQIAVSTGGQSPALAREIRRWLEPAFPPEYGRFVAAIGRARRRARAAAPTRAARLAAAERLVRDGLAGSLADPGRALAARRARPELAGHRAVMDLRDRGIVGDEVLHRLPPAPRPGRAGALPTS